MIFSKISILADRQETGGKAADHAEDKPMKSPSDGEAPPHASRPAPPEPGPEKDAPAKSRSRFTEPKWRFFRIPAGILLVLGGLAGFLPLVGFWMLPLGLAILAVDIPAAERLLRKLEAWRRRARRP